MIFAKFIGIIIGLSFLIVIIRKVFYFLFLWQLKEYRLDRIIAHLETPIGKKLIFGKLDIIKWILFLGLLSTINVIIGISYFLFWVIWVIEGLFSIRELIIFRWRLPKFTLKAIFILTSIFLILLYFLIGRMVVYGPLIDRFIWLLVSITVFLFNIPTSLYKQIIIYRAKRRILSFPKLTVIGITGSYGKTSTKEFLATILSEKFKVAKTPEFTNTDIGIAKYILKELNNSYQVFVVEMGAYKMGEIKDICDMVKPAMGIITGINAQHLELFGSLENTKKAKYELIESLPENGIAIFNGENKECIEMSKWVEGKGFKTIVYDKSKEILNIKVFKDHLEFNFDQHKKSYVMQANLLGEQNIGNILAAIHVGFSLGVKMELIQKGVAKLSSPPHTMQLTKLKNKIYLIDDTFNANPDGVIAALDYMKIFRGKKILVLTPLIELGQEAEKIHKFLGERIARICDLILLTNPNHHKSFIEGVKKSSGEDKVRIVNTLVGAKLVRENLSQDGVIVFEGKEAGRLLERLGTSH